MLFGNYEFRVELLSKIKEYEKKYKIKVIYIGTVGSISRGITDYNSDYDVKCLFVYDDKKLLKSTERHAESIIRFREFDSNKTYNCIAFWEVSAFINFLYEPYIGSGNKYDLARNVFWLMSTPYTWDPLGLQIKLKNEIEQCMNINNEKTYHYKNLISLLNYDIDMNNMRRTIRLLYELLSIDWIEKKASIPPINILSLLPVVINQKDKENIFALLTNHIEKDFVDGIYKLGKNKINAYEDTEYNFEYLKNNKCHIDNMFDVLNFSLKNIPIIKEVNEKNNLDENLRVIL